MAGTALEYDFSELSVIQQRLDSLSNLDKDDLLASLGQELEAQTRRRIAEEKTSPDGEAWKDLSEGWKARKAQTSSGGLLEFEGHLLDSIAWQTEDQGVAVGSERIYAAIQQFGGEDVGRPGHPARPFLGLSPENADDLETLVKDFLEAA